MFTSSFYSNKHGSGVLKWRRALPPPLFMLAALVSKGVINLNAKAGRGGVVRHVALGCTLGVMCLGTWWITSGRHLIKGMKKVKKS